MRSTYTSTDVCNRIVLAKCCLSDIVIKMFDAQSIGDTESENCYLEKAIALQGAIDALCRWWEPTQLSAQDQVRALPSGGKFVVGTWTFGGEAILPHGNEYTTDIATSIIADINGIVRTGNITIVAKLDGGERININYLYPNSLIGETAVITPSQGTMPTVRSEPEATVDVEPLPCLDDDGLEGIFNIIDKVCGCNCPEEHTTDFTC